MTPGLRTDDLSRRDLLKAGAAAGVALAVPGCSVGTRNASAAVDGPNVVVIVIDSLRKDHVGAYAGGRSRATTPSLDELGREALRFTRARHEAYPTIPVRRALMTGRRVFPFRGWRPVRTLPDEPGWEGIDNTEGLWTDVLKRRGYLTGYVTDNPHILQPPFDRFRRRLDVATSFRGQVPLRNPSGVSVPASELQTYSAPELAGKDFARVNEYLGANSPGGRRPSARREDEYLAAQVFMGGIDFLRRAKRAGGPFALVVDSFDCHEPWDAPDRIMSRYSDDTSYKPIQPFGSPAGRWSSLSARTQNQVRALYKAEVTFMDLWVGNFLDELDTLGFADDTWVVLVSDHGCQLGERDKVGKSTQAIHRELIDVPFMVRHPDRNFAGKRNGYFASAHDIGRTVLTAAGAKVPRRMNGNDLGPVFEGKRAEPRPVFTSAWNDKVIAGDERFLLVANTNGRQPRLHDVKRDRGEKRNIAFVTSRQVRRLYTQVLKDAGNRALPRF